jgi:hypothetical protein
VGSLCAPHEKDIIDALLTDLNNTFSFEFGTDITVNREGAGQKRTSGSRKIVVIGGSNASRLTTSLEELGECTSLIKMPSNSMATSILMGSLWSRVSRYWNQNACDPGKDTFWYKTTKKHS